MEITGIPLHPLMVHAAVVFTPVAALVALAYVLVGRWREGLRRVMPAAALAAVAAVAMAFLSGRSYLASTPELAQIPLVQTHQGRAGLLILLTLGFGLVAVVTAVLHARPGAARTALRVLLVVASVAVLVQVVLTGDAGTRAVWGADG